MVSMVWLKLEDYVMVYCFVSISIMFMCMYDSALTHIWKVGLIKLSL